MKFSTAWLQQFFAEPLPAPDILAQGLTSHVFEVEGITPQGADQVIDISITPNRGHDCFSHLGIARELSAIFSLPLKEDPFATPPAAQPMTDRISVTVDSTICKRYMAAYIHGVRVQPSPQWLQDRLAAIGQRSINNVVDATNFVMFSLGQPLHAFDAKKLSQKEGTYAIAVAAVPTPQIFQALDGKEYQLVPTIPAIIDAHSKKVIGIAGIKGGTEAAIDATTTDIIIESANFDGVIVRKAAQALKLRTDASSRFEQGLSPEFCGYAMDMVMDLIIKLARGEKGGCIDLYPAPQEPKMVSLSVAKLQQYVEGFGEAEMVQAFTRLGFSFEKEGEYCIVRVPFARLDITLPEDLIEEIVRIIGYDRVPALPLPPFKGTPVINKTFYWTQRIRSFLISKGCCEVYTSVFASSGEIVVLNKVEGNKPYLRNTLLTGLQDAVAKNARNKELLSLQQVQLFEIGTVWRNGEEKIYLGIGVEATKKGITAADLFHDLEAQLGIMIKTEGSSSVREAVLPELLHALPEPTAYDPVSLPAIRRYVPFSKYPFIIRDIAVWVPKETTAEDILNMLKREAGPLCLSLELFDSFEKEGRISFAFRLIFQSFERTLLDEEVTKDMERIYLLLSSKGFAVR